MNKFLKLSTTALLLSGLAMSGTAMAATVIVPPKLKADSSVATIGETISINVAANDRDPSSRITGYTAGRARYGSVSCSAAGTCTYTATPSKAKGKRTDSFSYYVTYKDSRGKTRQKLSRVTIRLKVASLSGSAT